MVFRARINTEVKIKHMINPEVNLNQSQLVESFADFQTVEQPKRLKMKH